MCDIKNEFIATFFEHSVVEEAETIKSWCNKIDVGCFVCYKVWPTHPIHLELDYRLLVISDKYVKFVIKSIEI